jgi:hypothetical protein
VYVKLDIMAKTVIKVRKQLLWILDDEKLEDIKEVSRSRKSKMDNTKCSEIVKLHNRSLSWHGTDNHIKSIGLN